MSEVIYDKGGLRAELFDNEAVAIYVENVLRVEMTREELAAVAMANMLHDSGYEVDESV